MSIKNQIPFKWQSKTFALLFFGFILFTVIGTLTHECGHYLVARYFGYTGGRIGYGYTFSGKNETWEPFRKVWQRYRTEIKNGTDFPGKQEFETEREKYSKENFMIEAGGPLETVLTGTIGLLLLIIFRQKFFDSNQLNLWQWLIIFITLFWLRGTFNFICRFGFYLVTGNKPIGNDEFNLSLYLGLGIWTLSITSAIIGALVLTFVILKIIPIRQRFTFICAGLSGGLSGAVLWLGVVGPRIMP